MPFFNTSNNPLQHALAGKFKNLLHGARDFALDKAIQLRDEAIVPTLDRGIESGDLPGKEAMFVRYLTGTDKPLNVLPPSVREAVPAAVDRSLTRDRFRNLYGENYDLAFPEAVAKAKAEYPDLAPRFQMEIAEREAHNAAEPFAGQTIPVPAIDEQGLLDIQYKDYNESGVRNNVRHPLSQTLGRFHSDKDGNVIDRYDFANHDRGMQYANVQTGGAVEAANFLAKKLGLINHSSGYEINAPIN